MIEKLMNPERPYGDPEYSKYSEQINMLLENISHQLPLQCKNQVEQLSDAYIHRETVALCDAFTDGFCTAMQLIADIHRRSPD